MVWDVWARLRRWQRGCDHLREKLRRLQLTVDRLRFHGDEYLDEQRGQPRVPHVAGLGVSSLQKKKKQLDYITGPKDIRPKTWYLNRVRLRTWDHHPVITKIEGRELRTNRGVIVWAG